MFKFLVLLVIFLFSQILISYAKSIEELEKNLVNYYINGYNDKIKTTLNDILAINENKYKTDKEIIDYWNYVDNKMKLYRSVPSNGLPTTKSHAFVVLGLKLNDDGSLKQEAIERCNVAYECAKKYPNSKIFLTGGHTANNNTMATEAEKMKEYLVKVKGLKKNRMITETESLTTKENAKFTFELLSEYNIKSITIVSSDYHIRRGSILFKAVSLEMAQNSGKKPIELLENAVWNTGSNDINKVIEGNALASMLNIKIS